MTRKSYVQVDGVLYEKGTEPIPVDTFTGVMVTGDLPDFVSPIDGKVYHGRAGLRDHCARHDVVPNADLKGLPTLMSNSDMRSAQQKKADAAHRKEQVIQHVDRNYRKYNP